jgi:hypothetical protein
MAPRKILQQVLSGSADASIRFVDLCNLLKSIGFRSRSKRGGSHRIFYKDGVEELINLQRSGSQAKPYQVKQVRAIILKYRLGPENL